MKGLKEFLELLKENEGLKAEVERVKDDTAKIVEIAKKHGYEFTEDEFDDLKMAAVSGGADLVGMAKDAYNSDLGQKVAEEMTKFAQTEQGQDLINKGKDWLQSEDGQKTVDFFKGLF